MKVISGILQVLGRDVEAPLGEGIVQVSKRSGHVSVHMDIARAGGPGWQLHLRKAHGPDRRAHIGVMGQLLGGLGAEC
jgi:hypothetical protein